MNIQDFNIKRFGNGTPIIMLHGFQLDQVSLISACEPNFSSEAFERIYLDLPGMGLNQNISGIKNADDMISVLIEVINHVIKDKAFYILGMSYGGYLARGISQKMKDRCMGMFLLVPVVYPLHAERTLPKHEVVIEDISYTANLEKEYLLLLREGNAVITERVVKRQEEEIDKAVARGNEKFLEEYQQTGYKATFDVDEESENNDTPVLIVAGKQDSVVGFQDQFNLSIRYKRATFMAVDGAGHGLQYEKEEVFNQIFRMWISELSRTGTFV